MSKQCARMRLLHLAAVCLLLASVAIAHSTKPLPFKRIHTPVAPSLRLLRKSTNDPFALRKRSEEASNVVRWSDTLLLRFVLDDAPVSLVLRPTADLLHPNAIVNYHKTDQLTGETSVRTERLIREDIRAYEGVVVHEEHVERWWNEELAGVVRPWSGEEPGRTRGWARLTLQNDDDSWDGAMQLDNDIHHFKPLTSYLKTRSSLDPEPPLSALVRRGKLGGGTIVMRDSDVMTPEQHTSACSHDSLSFNVEPDHPVFVESQRQALMALDYQADEQMNQQSWLDSLLGFGHSPIIGSTSRRSYPPSRPLERSLDANTFAKRQDIGGGNITSSFVDTIGSTSGCPKQPKVVFVGIAADCNAVQAYGSQDAARTSILSDLNSVSAIYSRAFNVSIGVVELNVVDPTCPSTASSSAPWNVRCASGGSGPDLNDRLSLFSQWRGNKGGGDGAGLWHLSQSYLYPICSRN